MNSIDNALKKMLGNAKKKSKSNTSPMKGFSNMSPMKGLSGMSPMKGFSMGGSMNKMLGNKMMGNKMKGASIPMQSLWSGFSKQKKKGLRTTLIDSDKDGVPNKFDCQPHNAYKQDSEQLLKEKLYNKWFAIAQKLRNQVSNLGYPVSLVTLKSFNRHSVGSESFKNNLFDYQRHWHNKTPVDVYANIPNNSNIGKKLSSIGKNPSNWWLRWDTDAGWEILRNGAMDYQGSNYDAYLIDGDQEGPMNIVNRPNINLVPFDEAF